LASGDGVDRAFRKLDQLRPYIVWWRDGGEAAHLLASGDAMMTSAPSDAVIAVNRKEHRNFALQWAGNQWSVAYWGLVKGAPNQRQAVQFLYFIATPAVGARLATRLAVGPVTKGATDLMTPEDLAVSPANPANLQAGLRQDNAFWRDNLDKLRQRFEAWQSAH
jgi:putative spermidine/putrescine transport system substrate-binding protein